MVTTTTEQPNDNRVKNISENINCCTDELKDVQHICRANTPIYDLKAVCALAVFYSTKPKLFVKVARHLHLRLHHSCI